MQKCEIILFQGTSQTVQVE